MTSPATGNSKEDRVDRALRVMHDIQDVREATVAVPGKVVDRLLARLIDLVLLTLMAYLGTSIYDGAVIPEATFGIASINLTIMSAWLGLLAIAVAYEALPALIFGSTPGKLRTQLHVVERNDLQPAGPARLILRTLVFGLPLTFAVLMWFYSVLFAWTSVVVLIGMYCWRFRDDGGRPLWDVVAGTHVMTSDFEMNQQALDWPEP